MPKKLKNPGNIKVAIFYDQLTKLGGGEWHMKAVSEIYPEAPIYTSVADKEFTDEYFPDRDIRTTFVQKLPFEKKLRQEYSILWPWGFQKFNVDEYDVVIAISAAHAKNVQPTESTKYVLNCLTPPRFLWMPERRSTTESERITYKIYKSLLEKPLHKILRRKDKESVKNADKVVANSKAVQERIEKFYGVESEIVHPPVDIESVKFNSDIESRGDYYLYLGRVEKYKGVGRVVKACAKLGRKLIVAGKGAYLDELREWVKSEGVNDLIKLEGFVTEDRKYSLLYNSRALIFPVTDEDFGIVPVEANAAGCPVIAFRGGGPIETLSEEHPVTAVFYNEDSVESLVTAIKKFENTKINPDNCRKQAKMFSKKIFKYKIQKLVEETVKS